MPETYRELLLTTGLEPPPPTPGQPFILILKFPRPVVLTILVRLVADLTATLTPLALKVPTVVAALELAPLEMLELITLPYYPTNAIVVLPLKPNPDM